VLAQQLGERWKVPVIVDNQPGASGSIGAQA
jgi:tripartite-type tricarboxylate transporter receptor subunit TctC